MRRNLSAAAAAAATAAAAAAAAAAATAAATADVTRLLLTQTKNKIYNRYFRFGSF